MARCVTLVYGWILLSGIVGVFDAVSISDPPTSTTVVSGENVTLNCGITDPLKGNFVLWKYFSDEVIGGKQLYDSKNDQTVDATKYEIAGDYNLKIINIQLANGGKYGCVITPDDVIKYADIVVLDRPVLGSGAVDVKEGTVSTIKCSARFGSEKLDESSNMRPLMGLWVGTTNRNANTKIEWAQTGVTHSIVGEVEYTANRDDDGQKVSCRLFKGEQQNVLMAEVSESLNIKYELSRVDYKPKKEVHYVGGNITCEAHANPAPEFTWTAVRSPAQRVVSDPVLDIQEDMIGDNEWTCTAKDAEYGSEKFVTVSFTVESADEDPNNKGGREAATAGRKSSWPIAVGIVIAIVVICLIVIVVFLVVRRRRMAEDDMKEPPHRAEETNGTKDATPVPSTPQPENPGYAGPYKGDGSQNDVSVYPGRESPGYGDLGIRHLGGSNPGLDSQVNTAPDPGASRAVRPAAYSNEMFQGSPKLAQRQQEGGSAV